jgi:hypothetical protein
VKRLALAALVFAGCATAAPKVSLGEPPAAPVAKDYVDQLKKWTRHGHLFSDFDAALDVDATMRSPEFRAAYAAKYLEVYRVEPEHQPKVRGDILSDGADTYEFHVETATHDYELNDLVGAKSVWRVTLVDDTRHEVTAQEVSAIKERRRLDSEFYPYATYFTRGWRIRFPRTRTDGSPLVSGETKTLTLRFAGPQGSVDLRWDLE